MLWAMDGAMAFSLTAGVVNLYTLGGRIPEIIVMGVGYPSEEGMAGLGKRTFDLFPPGSVVPDEGPASDYMKEELGFDFEAVAPLLKGDRFLDILVDQLRSSLSDKYRMADDHTLWGHSAGGAFAGYALLARPCAFDRFIIGKRYERPDERVGGGLRGGPRRPGGKGLHRHGGRGGQQRGTVAQRLVSRTTLLAENLRLRRYPGLDLRTRLYTDRDHITMMPLLIADGLPHVYADLIADLPKPPW